MFAKAYELASSFTQPVITSIRFFDNSVACGVAAFIVINDGGWIITVAHIWNAHFAMQQHKQSIEDYYKNYNIIQNDKKLDPRQKRKRITRLKVNPKWIKNFAFWWGRDGSQLQDIKALPEADLIIGRLYPFDPKWIKNYPISKNPSTLKPGTSLCKLGFPFHEIEATFNESKDSFELAPNSVPLPLFPLEGIYTRNLIGDMSKDGKYKIKFLETSSPGLRGQSGGPIFDINGIVWTVQSQTRHLQLGFSPKGKKNGGEVEEHQFLNVGIGVHPELLVSFLNDNGIKITLSDY